MPVDHPSCECGNAISPRSTTGRCRSCGRKAADTPEVRARIAASNRATLANMSEGERERRRQHARWMRENHLTRDAWEKSQRPEVRASVGRQNTERRIGWCPPERREEYFRLQANKRMTAAEARECIEADIASAELAGVALAVAPARPPRFRTFEDQLEAVRRGANLVEIATLRRPDPSMTLGGVATGAL